MVYNLIDYPKFRHYDPTTGLPAVGWKVYTYQAGTSTEQTTYQDKECSTSPNTNPIILDSKGEAIIYTNVPLKLVLYNTLDVLAWSQDYLATEQDVIITATEDSVTNNLWAVSSSPAQTTLPAILMLVFQPSEDNADTLTGTVFTGTGINDATYYGPYTGSTSGSTFEVEIDGTGSPDTFKWRKDSEDYVTTVSITGAQQSLKEGVSVIFSRTTGHTSGDKWTLTVERPVRIDLDGLGAKLAYKNVGGSLQALDGSDMKANYPSNFAYSSTSDAYILLNPQAPDLKPSAVTVDRPRRSIDDDHVVTTADNGYELSFTGSRTVTLPAAASFPNNFVYINNAGTGTITINADGSEKIYYPFDINGSSTIYLEPNGYNCIQLASNSVDWHILTATTNLHGLAVYTSSSGNWTNLYNVSTIYVTAVPGGGGSGGASATGNLSNTYFANASAGGKAGTPLYRSARTVVPGASYAYSVGSAGSAGSTGLNNGGSGGNTTLATPTPVSTTGGAGGGHSQGITHDGEVSSVFDGIAIGTEGQGSILGSGGRPGFTTTPGTSSVGEAGIGYGAGGGGSAVIAAISGTTACAGRAGQPGILIIEW